MNDYELHQQFMQQALVCAEARRGFCAPNPAVGAIVVKDNKVLATGTHWAAGEPHAEADALNKLGDEAIGAVMYVTLEPCCHYGKTPPCTDLIINRGLKKVYYGFRDTNPKMEGEGVARLQAANIECHYLAYTPVKEFYRSYHYWWRQHKPWVTAKLAMSQDGKIAGPNGARIDITGREAQIFTHQWRKRSDALLTTVKTIIQDDPQLNVRLDDQVFKKTIYILDSQLRLPSDAKIFQTSLSLTVFYSSQADAKRVAELQAKKVKCVLVPYDQRGLDLNNVLDHIGRDGIHDLWLEAGGRCFQSFFQQNLLNRVFLYIAPKQLGSDAQSAFSESFDIVNSGCHVNWQTLGQDLVCELVWSRT